MRVTILGSGTSKGVPEAACDCDTCHSDDPRDKRRRASVLVKTMGLNILIDPSPDFRQQALDQNLHRIDAVLLTHSHYDHVGGMDDLRPYCAFTDMVIYAKEDVDSDLHRRLDYCFRESKYPGVPTFNMQIIDNNPFYIKGVRITPIEVLHGKLPIFGYRIGRFAYVTDAKTIPDNEMDKLYGLDVLILNSLRFTPHFSHLSVPEALEIIKEVEPKETYLTHFCHHVGRHEDIERKLPPHVHPAYDNLHLTIE
ncbi:MAG: MBL fold metallo-hydrolase [Muribaculum sp.]|nr:MBL fold metallo-hydrolase [Muribaculum sp.]